MVVEETISYININGNEHPIDACSIDGKNDEYFQESGKLVNHISSSSTDDEYPSAKCLYDMIWGIGGEHKDDPSYDYSKDYLTFEAVDDGTFKFTRNSLEYSIDDGNTWVSLPANTDTPTVSSGNKIMFKQTGLIPKSSYGIGTFSSTGRFNVYGNIMSLLYGDDFDDQTSLSGKSYAFRSIFNACSKILNISNLILPATTLEHYCYAYMFSGCTGITSTPELPATTLSTYCYIGMFNGCTGITTAPELPATILENFCYSYMFSGCINLATAPELPATEMYQYCYQDMFSGCSSLTTVPELPATTLNRCCYQDMFYGCTSLTTAPELPAIRLSYGCYMSMFRNCTNLTTAPELPATTMYQYCYQEMFYGCTSLTTTPELPATSLAYGCYKSMFKNCRGLTSTPVLQATTLSTCCYQEMFYGCTSLTTTPELPATNMMDNCYDSMFRGCTGLTSTPVLSATRLVSGCYRSMFYGCTNITSTTSLPATTLSTYCYQNMFYGCTSLLTAPELPATTLIDNCYDSMFYGCRSLTTAPRLPATSLVNNCYYYMFYRCQNLNYIECDAVNGIIGTYNLTNWVYGVSGSGQFVGNQDATWIISNDGIPINWTYNVDIIKEYQSSNRYGMYIDDFNDVELSNETIDYNGETYYVWTRKNIDDSTSIVRYALTETNDYNTLYNLSLESDLDNLTQHPVSYFFSDIDTPYTSGENQTLIKIENHDDYMSMWVDDFYYNNVASFIADPISNDCNAFEYTGEDITYDGDDYYVWKNMGFMRSNGADGSYNRTYVLTDTINQNILQQKSLEYSTSNLTEKPISAFLDADSREYENGNCYSIISLRNTTGIEMWIDKEFDVGWDDGGYSDMEEYLDWYLSDVNRGGGKHYYYIDTFEYNGDTCYIWYNYADKTYVITETINISTLTSYSIESNYSNVNTHPLVTFLNKDFEEYGVVYRDASEYSIVKVTSSQPSMMIWVDEFMKDDFDFNDIIDDPEYSGANEYVCGLLDIGDNLLDLDDPGSVGANYYEYCEPFEYNGETYYIWVYSYDGYNDYTYDHLFNVKYILTDTIDFNTLRSYSLEYDMSNLSTYPIVAYLGLDLSTTYEHDDRDDNIVKVFEL